MQLQAQRAAGARGQGVRDSRPLSMRRCAGPRPAGGAHATSHPSTSRPAVVARSQPSRQVQPRLHRRRAQVAAAAGGGSSSYSAALIFDCDGVIVETEELHRLAYNGSFQAFGLTIDGTHVDWSVEYYDTLQQTVGGGKPKMRHHFGKFGWPATQDGPVPAGEDERTTLIDALQDKKTEIYKRIVEEVAEARPGVIALMDAALARPDLAVCICSAATKAGFEKIVNCVVGLERLAKFDIILAGDDVNNKKPHPEIYETARGRLGLPADRCLVIEDSLVGLRAAAGASMNCLVTYTASTAGAAYHDEGALAVAPALAGPGYVIGVDDLFVRDGAGAALPNPQLQSLIDARLAAGVAAA